MEVFLKKKKTLMKWFLTVITVANCFETVITVVNCFPTDITVVKCFQTGLTVANYFPTIITVAKCFSDSYNCRELLLNSYNHRELFIFIYFSLCKVNLLVVKNRLTDKCFYVHFVYLFAPWTQGVNLACNKTFRSCPECLSNVLRTFRKKAISKTGTYI